VARHERQAAIPELHYGRVQSRVAARTERSYKTGEVRIAQHRYDHKSRSPGGFWTASLREVTVTVNVAAPLLVSTERRVPVDPRVLLVGPFDPSGGEFTFLSPPLGIWRLCGVLNGRQIEARVFDPNCVDGRPADAFANVLSERPWDIVGFSMTGMTLPHDLSLAHQARRLAPDALIVAGGMEATFNPELLFELGPFDLLVLGEGEKPMLELVDRLRRGAHLVGIAGTAAKGYGSQVQRWPQPALSRQELRDAIVQTPYHQMPYAAYWRRLESAYQVGQLPVKAEREARLAEIRSVRLATLNYCPLGCSFCSSTHFLNAAQGGTARVARLDAEETTAMITRIVSACPGVQTIIFQDDIFVFTADDRLVPLCEAIIAAKRQGLIPPSLQFISTNRVDSMTPDRLALMRRTGFRVLGFGIESASLSVLTEFKKARIFPHIRPVLETALALGITPFLDLILTSPQSRTTDLAETIRSGYQWILDGCEAGMYPYVIPFSGAAMASDPSLLAATVYRTQTIEGTGLTWRQPTKILPLDPVTRDAILSIEEVFEARLAYLETRVPHLPSRVRSLLWVSCAIPILRDMGQPMPSVAGALEHLVSRLPGVRPRQRRSLSQSLRSCEPTAA
jgi:radical SAM superfamily enzyme YgiQ (UPF0313 family)